MVFLMSEKPTDFGTLTGYEKGMKTAYLETVRFRYSR
jgi:hypothetical protein